jgi:hypothetical protein
MKDERSLTESDRQLLDAVDQILSGGAFREHQEDSLYGTCAYLARVETRPNDKFTRELEDRLLVVWEQSRRSGKGASTARSPVRSIRSALAPFLAPHGQFSLVRGIVAAFLAIALLIGLAATALAVYMKIVVGEPSFDVASLDEAMRPAQFPVWVPSQGQLMRVYTLGNPNGSPWEYNIVVDYRLQDGRRFTVIQSKALPEFNLQQQYEKSQQDDPDHMRVLDGDVDINRSRGILYQIAGELVGTPPPGWRPWETHLVWQSDGTRLSLNENVAYPLISPGEMTAIARSIREAKH